ncbi:ABC transporter permease [Humitalea sp. 24SJ18S-53]|uniref:ABC transporter permease n=1 Tax=Humitalea sp. 24SJ18S-53 TaxID=3422307 RepID=UPI003D678B22
MKAMAPSSSTLIVTSADHPDYTGRALDDLKEGFRAWRLSLALARLDLRNRYRGSVLGPFWFTLSSAVMVAGLGLLYSQLFKINLTDYLPHLAVSLIVWQMISGLITDAVACMTGVEGVIRQVRLPYTVHALRCTLRNALTALHQIPLIVLVFVVLGHNPGWSALLVIPGIAILCVNGFASCIFLGMVCARFRDVGHIIGNVLQLAFFLTPIMWKPDMLGDIKVWLPLNPFYALLETLRGPLVEGGGAPLAWLAALVFTSANCAIAFMFFARFRSRIAFWV